MKPTQTVYRTPVRWAAPQAIALARGLAWLHGKAIDGSPGNNGSIRYGWPGLDTDRTFYKGYAFPPQLFSGYDPAKVAAGLIRPDPASYPGDSMSPATAASPLNRAMETATFGVTG
jgi:hypothetical protein